MVESITLILYVILFISMSCSLLVALRLYTSEKNYLIAVLSAATALIELVMLLSVIWINDFEHSVPKGFCTYQGIAIQYCAYLQMMSAVCFSIHLYNLLVLKKRRISQTIRKGYIYSIIIVPIIMTVIVAVVSIKTKAIKPFALSCDIKSPPWVRLLGYSGFNLVLTFFGVYFSARATYKVFMHLDQFKSQLSNSTNLSNVNSSNSINNNVNTDSTTHINAPNETSNVNNASLENGVRTEKNRNLQRSYNLTKAAAIRMVLFSLGFALINVLASVQTVLLVLKGKQVDDTNNGVRGADFAVAFTGIIIYIVFGLPQLIKKLSCFRQSN